jgi:hypothetical protein
MSSYLPPVMRGVRMRWSRGRYVPTTAPVVLLNAAVAKRLYTAKIIARTIQALYAQGGVFGHKPGGYLETDRDYRRTVLSVYYDAKGSIANVWG